MFENHCFSFQSLPHLTLNKKVFSQTSMGVWGKTRNKSVSWGNGQLKARPEIDKIGYLQAAVTGPKNAKNWTPFPKPTSFYCKVVHGHLLPHRSPSGRLPLKTAGSKHLKSFSFCGNGYRASGATMLPQQRRRWTITCEIRVTKVSLTPHKNTEGVMRGTPLVCLWKVGDKVPTCELWYQ